MIVYTLLIMFIPSVKVNPPSFSNFHFIHKHRGQRTEQTAQQESSPYTNLHKQNYTLAQTHQERDFMIQRRVNLIFTEKRLGTFSQVWARVHVCMHTHTHTCTRRHTHRELLRKYKFVSVEISGLSMCDVATWGRLQLQLNDLGGRGKKI